MSVRTRFAPSPTGFLHIGGVRTALFNWLLARHHGGQFILRIDDTDQQRHVEDAVKRILDGFRWMGIDWDEGPEVGGPSRPVLPVAAAETTTARPPSVWSPSGHVYRDYSTEAERAADKAAAERAEACLPLPPQADVPTSKSAQFEAEGRPFALRFQVPPGRTLVLHDLIKGDVEFATDEIGDFVIVRPDGTPLYNFASVVDDVDMQITHVVRAEEHLSNTFPQLLVFEALGATLPAVRPHPLRGRAGLEGEDVQAEDRGIREARDLGLPAPVHREGLSARGAAQLPRPARLELRRHAGDLHPRRADREVHARPGQQLARQPRPGQAVLDRGRVDEDPPAGAEGRGGAPVPEERGPGRRAALDADRAGSRPSSRPWATGSRSSPTSSSWAGSSSPRR